MYLFFDRNGTLKEQITVSPPRYGDENVNAIHVYWDNEVTQSISKDSVYCRYKKPDGNYTLNLVADDVVNESVPYDPNRDLKFFNYNQNYRFYVFNIPSDIFVELENVDVYTVLFSCWFIYNTNQQKTMGLVAFAVEPSTQSVAVDQNINIAQWNALINMLTGTADLINIDVLSITFKESENPSEDGLSMNNNVIYWRGVKLVTLTDLNAYVTTGTAQDISGYKTFLGGIGLENAPLEIENGSEVPLGVFTVHDNDNTTDYNIKADGGEDDATYDIELPNKSGRLAVTDEVVLNTSDQDINGQKTFKDKIILEGDAGDPLLQIDATDMTEDGNQSTFNIKVQDLTQDGATYDITLPNVSCELVGTEGGQSIKGQKIMHHLNVNVQNLPNSNGMLAFNNNKYYGRVNGNNKEILTQDALTPTILAPVTCGLLDTIAGGETSVLITGGIGSHTVNVIDDYEIVAEVNSGSITNINQTTGAISIISSEETVELSWHYESTVDTRIGFRFNIGSDYNGIYVFTHSYLTMLVPIYALTEGQTYKFTGAGLQDGITGSVISMIHNMQRNGQYLDIWSGNSDYPMIAGRVGTLAKVKLY